MLRYIFSKGWGGVLRYIFHLNRLFSEWECMHMFFILYIPPYSCCNTPVHISYLVVYDSRNLRCSVYLFTGLALNGLNC